jgi:hypothetical protein
MSKDWKYRVLYVVPAEYNCRIHIHERRFHDWYKCFDYAFDILNFGKASVCIQERVSRGHWWHRFASKPDSHGDGWVHPDTDVIQ